MRPGKIFIMDSITPHNSNSVSTTPRLAINVKIQPRSLNYIYKIFGLTKAFKSNLKYNFEVLENDLKNCTSLSNSLNFELSVLYCMQRKFDQAFDTFNKFSLTKFSKENRKNLCRCFIQKNFRNSIKKTLRIFTRKI